MNEEYEDCPDCSGSGCANCGGLGRVFIGTHTRCGSCGGSGTDPLEGTCLSCGGTGAVPRDVGNDPRLLNRRSAMWMRNVKGLDEWRGRHWVGLSENKIIHLKDGRMVDPYGREIHDVDAMFDEVVGPLLSEEGA